MKNKYSVNIVVDILTLISMMLVSYSGFALQVRRSEWSDFALGMGRRFWYDVHIYAAIALLLLLALHVALHWTTVDAFFKKRIANKLLRIALYVVLLLMMLITVLPALYFMQ